MKQRLDMSQKAYDDLVAAVDVNQPLPVPDKKDFVVIGSGLAGLSIAATISDAGGDYLMIEKGHGIGGQWLYNANYLSRVNSSEPSYRMPYIKREKNNTNHSHHFEVLNDLVKLAREHVSARAAAPRAALISSHVPRVE